MDLRVNKDSVGTIFSGIPSIDTNNLITQVLVENGETVVLEEYMRPRRQIIGGRYLLLGDIPMIGVLFRNKNKNPEEKGATGVYNPQNYRPNTC